MPGQFATTEGTLVRASHAMAIHSLIIHYTLMLQIPAATKSFHFSLPGGQIKLSMSHLNSGTDRLIHAENMSLSECVELKKQQQTEQTTKKSVFSITSSL